MFNDRSNSAKNLWKHFGPILNSSKRVRSNISSLQVNGRKIRENRAIADAFNDFFSNVGCNLDRKIEKERSCFRRYFKDKISGSFFFAPILQSDVKEEMLKVAEDDIAFKLAILKKSLHLNDNTCFCSIIQSSKLVLGSLLAKNNFFVQFWMANCGSGLPAEWPFRSQNAIEASDSPLPGGLWVKRLITHALCSLAY